MERLYIIIIVTLILSAFFSGIEIAYLVANKLRIELKNQKGVLSARILSFFIKKPSHFLTTTLIGNNIALIVYGIWAAKLIELNLGIEFKESQPEIVIFLIQTLLSSLVVLVFGEFIPKALFRNNPNNALTFLAFPFLIFYYILYPLVILIEFLSRFLLKYILKVNVGHVTPVYDRHDLMHYVTESAPAEENAEMDVDTQIFKNAIEFQSLKVRECMIPRTEIVAIEVTDSIESLKEKFTQSGHSKIVVYRESVDNIIGYVHIVDLYRAPKSLDKIVMPIIIATESMSANELMRQLIEKRRSIAVVVDEFGGTSGIVTIEDIIEEIIGDIEDEHDVDDTVEKKINNNEYIFSARLEIDYLNETYGLNLPEGDYETLGGLIYFVNQNIPKQNQVITSSPFEFTVLSVEQTKINEVKLRLVDKSEQ